MSYYSYGNRIYSINEASTFTKWIKDEDLPEYTKQEEKREKKEAKELSSLVKKAKRSGELKKFKSKVKGLKEAYNLINEYNALEPEKSADFYIEEGNKLKNKDVLFKILQEYYNSIGATEDISELYSAVKRNKMIKDVSDFKAWLVGFMIQSTTWLMNRHLDY